MPHPPSDSHGKVVEEGMSYLDYGEPLMANSL